MYRPGLDALARALDDDVVAIAGAKMTFRRAGTATPLAVYNSPELSASLGSELTADAAGAFSQFWFDPSENYDADLKTAAGVTLKTFSKISTAATADGATEVANLTALRALLLGDTQAVVVRGRNSAGDGAGGVFVWVSGDQSANVSADPNQGVWVAPNWASTGASGAWRRLTEKLDARYFNADATGATDSSAALQAALNYGETAKRAIQLNGAFTIGGATIVGDNLTMFGESAPEALFPYTDTPAQLRITNTTNTPFKVGETVLLDSVTIFYPNQVDTLTGPIVYPPLFDHVDATTNVAGFKLDDVTILGATTICLFGGTSVFEAAGLIEFNNVHAYATGVYFDFTRIPDTIQFNNCLWGINVYGDEIMHFGAAGAGAILDCTITRSGSTATVTTTTPHGMTAAANNPSIRGATQAEYNQEDITITVTGPNTFTYPVSGSPATPATGAPKVHVLNLRDDHRDNGVWLKVSGNGTTSALSTRSIDGIFAANNVWLGFDTIIECAQDPAGGLLNIVTLTGGAIDGSKTLLRVRPGSACYVFNAGNLSGFQERRGDATWFGYFIDVEDPAPYLGQPLTEVDISDVELGYMRGGLATIQGDYVRRLSITDFSCPYMIHTTANGNRDAVYVDAPNADVILDMGRVSASRSATGTRTFVNIVNARSVHVDGVFDGWDCVIKNDSPTAKVSVGDKFAAFGALGDQIAGAYAGNVKVSSCAHIEGQTSLSQPAGENFFANGNFQINQRGTSFASGAIQMTADLWKATRAAAAAGATFSRQTGFNGAQFCYRLARDVGNALTDALYFAQQKRTRECHKFQGMEFFVGFDARKGANFSAASDLLTVTVFAGTGTDEVVNVATGFATGNWSASKTVALSATAGRPVVGPFDIPSNATEIAVVFSWTPVGTAGAADHCEITNISAGNLATAQVYNPRPLGEERYLCQRRRRHLGRELAGRWESASQVVLAAQWDMDATPTPTLLTTTPIVAEASVSNRTGSSSTIYSSSLDQFGGNVFIDGFSSATAGRFAVGGQADIVALTAEIGP